VTVNNSVSFGGSGKALIEISKSPQTNDLLLTTGTLTYHGTLIVTNLAGTLAAGDSFTLFSAPIYSGSFTNFSLPPTSADLSWDTSGLTNGVIRVVAINPPVIDAVTLNGDNLVISGAGGTANSTYYVLRSADVSLPMANWTRVATNTFDGTGGFSFTNAVDAGVAQTYYRLQLP
jgi:hypothetical protein